LTIRRALHSVDVIVSNPPYIPAHDQHLQQGDLRFEPQRALTDNHNGLSALATIIAGAAAYTQSYLQMPEQQQALAELIAILHELHPADMATLLESLPLQERMLVWKLATPTEDGEVLLEVSDPVRETHNADQVLNILRAANGSNDNQVRRQAENYATPHPAVSARW